MGFRVSFAWLAGSLVGESASRFADEELFLDDVGLALLGVEVFFGVLDLEGESDGEVVSFSSASTEVAGAGAAFLAEAFGVETLFPFFKGEGVLILVPVARACALVMRFGVDTGDAAGVLLLLPLAVAFFFVDFGVAAMMMSCSTQWPLASVMVSDVWKAKTTRINLDRDQGVLHTHKEKRAGRGEKSKISKARRICLIPERGICLKVDYVILCNHPCAVRSPRARFD